MPDTIHISNIEVHSHIGVPDEERLSPQRLLVSVKMRRSLRKAGRTDDLRHTVDYFQVYALVREMASSRPRHLIEHLAEEVAEEILNRFAVRSVAVEVRKFILPGTDFVSVRIRRKA